MENSRTKTGKAIMEMIGTAILLLTIQLAVGAKDSSLAPLAIGVALITIVYAGGPISGAHYNPAVSLAIMLRGKMSMHDMMIYWISQVVGGCLGALAGGTIGGVYSNIGIGDGFGTVQALLAEVVFTFLLCFVVLAVATHSKVDGNHYYGLAIGLVVASGAIAVGPISGGAFNPAVALGLAVAKGFDNMGYVLSVMVADLSGGMAAAACFYLVAPDQFEALGYAEIC